MTIKGEKKRKERFEIRRWGSTKWNKKRAENKECRER